MSAFKPNESENTDGGIREATQSACPSAIGEMIAADKCGRFELFIEGGNIKIWRDTSDGKYYCSDGRKNSSEPKWLSVEYVISVNKEKWDKWDFSREDEELITDSVAYCEISLDHEIDGIAHKTWFEIID